MSSSPASTGTTCWTAAPDILPPAFAKSAHAAPSIRIEILTPDFRGRIEKALDALAAHPARCLQPQLGNGSPPVPRSATGRRLRKLPTPSRKIQRTAPVGADKIRADGRPRRRRRRNSPSHGRFAPPPGGHADGRPIPAADTRPPSGASVCFPPPYSIATATTPKQSASPTPPAARLFAPPTTRPTQASGLVV